MDFKFDKMVFKCVFGFLLGVNSPRFQNNFSAKLFARFFGDSWGVELCIALCVPLQRIFENGKIVGV